MAICVLDDMLPLTCLVAASLLTPQITTTSDLVGDWEGLSLCTDKIAFPAVHDEQWICHVRAKDAKTVIVTINKVVNGKEVAMAPEPVAMDFDSKSATLSCRIVSGKTSEWTFHLNYSTWVGTAKNSDGKVFRDILVKRR